MTATPKHYESEAEPILLISELLEQDLIKPKQRSAANWLIALLGYYRPWKNRCFAKHTTYGYSARSDLTPTDKNDETVRKWSRRMMQKFAKCKAITVLDQKTQHGCNIIKINRIFLERWLKDNSVSWPAEEPEEVSEDKCPTKVDTDRISKARTVNIVPVAQIIADAAKKWQEYLESAELFIQYRISQGINGTVNSILAGRDRRQRQHLQGLQNMVNQADQAEAREEMARQQEQAEQRTQWEAKQPHYRLPGEIRCCLESEALAKGYTLEQIQSYQITI